MEYRHQPKKILDRLTCRLGLFWLELFRVGLLLFDLALAKTDDVSCCCANCFAVLPGDRRPAGAAVGVEAKAAAAANLDFTRLVRAFDAAVS